MIKHNLKKGDFVIWNNRPYIIESIGIDSFFASDDDGDEVQIAFESDWYHSSTNRAKYLKKHLDVFGGYSKIPA